MEALAISIFVVNGIALLSLPWLKDAKKLVTILITISGLVTLIGAVISIWANYPLLSYANWLVLPYLIFFVTLCIIAYVTRKKIRKLIADFQSGDSTVQLATAKALGKYQDKLTMKPFITRDLKVLLPPLVEALKDKNVDFRLKAIEILGELKDKQAIEPLIVTLKDEDPEVRLAVIRAMGNWQHPRFSEFFYASLGDSDETVKAAVLDMLEKKINIMGRGFEVLMFFARYGISETVYPYQVRCSRCQNEDHCQQYTIHYGRRIGEYNAGTAPGSAGQKVVIRTKYEMLGPSMVYLCKRCQEQMIKKRVNRRIVLTVSGVILIPLLFGIFILLASGSFSKHISNYDNLLMFERYALKVVRQDVSKKHSGLTYFLPSEYELLRR